MNKLALNLGKSSLKIFNSNILNTQPQNIIYFVRHGSSYKFNQNLEFVSADDSKIKRDGDSFKLAMPGGERPLTILMAWLMSKERHVNKFVSLYNHLGFDVLKVRLAPLDLLRPTKGAQLVAGDMLEFLHSNPRETPLLVHGFSVGAYAFCEALVQVEADFERHGPLLDRIAGQIWDSGVDMSGIPVGVSKSLTRNKLLQPVLEGSLRWFMNTQRHITCHYERAQEKMVGGYLNKPALFLISKVDPIGTPQMNYHCYNQWKKRGVPVFMKEFEDSPHVSHYYMHEAEYQAEMYAFLREIGMLESHQKKAVA